MDAVMSNQSREVLSSRRTEYIDLWTKYAEGRGGPELAGPVELLDPLSDLHQAVDAYSSTLDEWWLLISDAGQTNLDYYQTSSRLRNVVGDKRRRYQQLAIQVLG
ncbi:hypothetical protein [Nocardia sp. NPDC004860]|uniref:hypothetical protein n=1 Tax=Nocardia sp. NPDC004860 TaxID=3154557 RepID=UPI0033AF5086